MFRPLKSSVATTEDSVSRALWIFRVPGQEAAMFLGGSLQIKLTRKGSPLRNTTLIMSALS